MLLTSRRSDGLLGAIWPRPRERSMFDVQAVFAGSLTPTAGVQRRERKHAHRPGRRPGTPDGRNGGDGPRSTEAPGEQHTTPPREAAGVEQSKHRTLSFGVKPASLIRRG